jgi:hypothetical protein
MKLPPNSIGSARDVTKSAHMTAAFQPFRLAAAYMK